MKSLFGIIVLVILSGLYGAWIVPKTIEFIVFKVEASRLIQDALACIACSIEFIIVFLVILVVNLLLGNLKLL